MNLTNEEEKLIIQELELVLTKHTKKAEKGRKIAEAQFSYRAVLENKIRNSKTSDHEFAYLTIFTNISTCDTV